MKKQEKTQKRGNSWSQNRMPCIQIMISLIFILISVNDVYPSDDPRNRRIPGSPYPPHLPSGPDCDIDGASPYIELSGVGFAGQGAGIALGDINGNDEIDIVFLAYDDPTGPNDFRYRILWDSDYYTGESHTIIHDYHTAPGFGDEAMGAGISLVDIDNNGRLDMVLMCYDKREGSNKFRYRIGWDIQSTGRIDDWGDEIEVRGVGGRIDGAGIAIEDINGNGNLDMILMAYDDPAGRNEFRYRIGWDIDNNGVASSWASDYIQGPGVGNDGEGADLTIADVDLDGKLDMILMAYDSSDDWNRFKYRIGWSIQPDGTVERWSRWFMLKGVGMRADGAGLAFHYERTKGPVLYFMAYDKPEGQNTFRYFVLPMTSSGTCYGVADDDLPLRNDRLSVPTSKATQTAENLFNLNMTKVRITAFDALSSFLYHCAEVYYSGEIHNHPECLYHYPDKTVNFQDIFYHPKFFMETCPDLLVAAVVWYVSENMSYTKDAINRYVLNTIHGLGYEPEEDFPLPAYYTIEYTDPEEETINKLREHDIDWANPYDNGRLFHGDCEDYAIMRQALLRALRFDRHFLWNVRGSGHEQSAILYKGAYRIMGYGKFYQHLCTPCGSELRSAWNQSHGPRLSPDCPDYFKDYVFTRIYPDRCGLPIGLVFTRRVMPDFEKGTCPHDY